MSRPFWQHLFHALFPDQVQRYVLRRTARSARRAAAAMTTLGKRAEEAEKAFTELERLRS